MSLETPELPVGLAGLRYGVTQVVLAVRDMDRLLDLYYETFGWAPWQVFRHAPPTSAELRRRWRHEGRGYVSIA